MEYDFSFIGNTTLRRNVEHVLRDVSELMSVLWLQKKDRIKNCLRKTIIIYVASIVEALLLWKIESEVGSGEVVLPNEWKQYDVRVLFANEDFELISARRSREIKDVNKLDFNRMVVLCEQKKLINKSLLKDLDKVRKMRNKLHIGGVEGVTKVYTRANIEFVLEVLEKTMWLF